MGNGALVLALAAAVVWNTTAWAQSEEEIQKIEQAMPAKARVEPAKPRKLLVFNLCKGFAHSSIPYGAKAFEIMGRKTGAFEAVVSEDPAVFAPDSLAQFDAVVFNNSTGELFDDPALKQGLLDFVKNGKGIVGVHAATDCFYKWADYGEMMGGYFWGHPWGGGGTVTVKLDDPAHPLCAAFGGQGFDVNDEIYQIRDPYSREKLRVLLSLDTAKTDMKKGGIKRKDGDFAVSWIRSYGKGRVFYCSLGHNHHIFWTPALLEYYLDGIQFAMGDLEADTTPSAQLSEKYLEESQLTARRQAVDDILEEIVTYEFGHSRERFTELNDIIIASYTQPKFRKEIADKLAALLATDATRECKQFLCRQLYVIGTADQVPAIAALLTDPETSDMARYALERMPDPAADKALMDALAKVTGKLEIGVINSLGERRKSGAVPALAELTGDADAEIAAAAVAALGKIGGDNAAKALEAAKAKAIPETLSGIADAYLLCADKFLADGKKKKALAIYEEMFAVTEPKRVHVAAFEGLVGARGADAVALILETLAGDDAEMQAVAAGAARDVPGAATTQALAAQLPNLDAATQVMVVKALADRGDAVALPAVTQAAKSEDENVRRVALGALAALGDASSVALLAQVAATAEKPDRDVARDSLNRLRGDEIDKVMVDQLKAGDNNAALPTPLSAVRQELIRSLAARGATGAVAALLGTAADADEGIRAESFKALNKLASADDLPALVDLLAQAKGDDRKEGEKALVAVARKAPDARQAGAALLKALKATKDSAAKASLVRVLGELGDNSALDALRAQTKSADADVKDAAIRALADWPNAEPMVDLKKLAQKADSDTHKVLALRGYIRMLGMPSDRSAADTFKLFKEALDIADRPEEKKKVLAGLSNVRDSSVPELLKACLEDEDLKEEALKALEQFKNVGFKVSASHGNQAAGNAVDGKGETRWTTATPMKGGEWFMIDLGWEQKIRKIVLDTTGSARDYPRGYEVFLSNDGKNWGKPVVTGKGDKPVTEIAFEKPTACTYIKIVQTGKTDGLYWSIHELRLETE